MPDVESGGLIPLPALVTRVEGFVRAIVVGGVALVAGLWVATYFPAWSPLWALGAALALAGIAGLAGGIWTELDY